ncbi:putative acetate kinase [Clavispora lusitaniae]|uniref:Acetate kinase n=1 Tax=Clavispora lusitaniae TaxID=36911 RepID=A0AA91Q5B7_CLALS|nr:putative acetate kinase [Clavispora lusitaniae]
MCKKKFDLDDFVVFEKHMQWGGTWWANSYPGCASDIPASWYSIFLVSSGFNSELICVYSELSV